MKHFGIVLLFILTATVMNPLLESAEGLVEFKKYKVTNSNKVCGDKLCSDVDEQIAKQGRSSHNVAVCGYQLCSDKSMNKSIPTMDCKTGQQLVIKATTLLPACVNYASVEKLRNLGWAISEENQNQMFDILISVTDGVRLTVTPSEFSNQRYLTIDGHGWHRLHNVEITISSSDFEESIRSQTTDDGDLNTLWPIPDFVGGKMYHIFATDGIHKFELDIPISP